MAQGLPGSPPAASTEVTAKEGRKEGRKRRIGMTRELKGRRQDREEGKDSKDVEVLVCAHALTSPEHHSAPRNATRPSGPTTAR